MKEILNQPDQLIADIFVGKSMVQRLRFDAGELQENMLVLTSREPISLEPGQYIMKLGIATSINNQYSQNSAALPFTIN
jgi:hypothetical protein